MASRKLHFLIGVAIAATVAMALSLWRSAPAGQVSQVPQAPPVEVSVNGTPQAVTSCSFDKAKDRLQLRTAAGLRLDFDKLKKGNDPLKFDGPSVSVWRPEDRYQPGWGAGCPQIKPSSAGLTLFGWRLIGRDLIEATCGDRSVRIDVKADVDRCGK